MKTKIRFAGLLLALGLSFACKAQSTTYVFTNNLQCKVVLFYELRDATCNISSTGTVNINSGLSKVVNIPAHIVGGCLTIQQIGSISAPSNHLWISLNPSVPPCHNNTHGQTETGCGGFYSVTTTPNSWTIN
ncbi:hypothetical protein DBR32_14085 [Taibaiella sp. KBW10]|uniref:hypothetical protein n=1 Tax=Taibaiella sp. KBW10 TaxID=2153357 RepID=UPI000F599C2B|nr:hypothetical protein [Taibaiella sp. KBW10]RQO30031.1 hypothetical protein DBR32_14085 [Taibaiella sp. KBW10]